MWFDPSDVTLTDLKAVLDEFELDGVRRHLMIELYLVQHLREWERPTREVYFLELLQIQTAEAREMMRDMVHDGLIICSQDVKSGEYIGINLSHKFLQVLHTKSEGARAAEAARHRARFGPRPPTDGVKRRTRELFEDTCELCGDKAVRGKDQRGQRMRVARVKKDKDGVAENVTLLCSRCSVSTRGQDLPADSRTLQMLEVAEQRGYEFAPRTALPPPTPIKEVVLIATGPISVKTRNVEVSSSTEDV